jgi:glycosyltransferase involved in cell wall biosynthesis
VVASLRGADALLLVSVTEGLPTVILEAMACGVPVVASDCGGVSEALRHGVEGFLVAPRSPAQTAAALLELWRDPDLGRRMGRAGRARVQAGFSLHRQLDDFAGLYRELAVGANGRARLPSGGTA